MGQAIGQYRPQFQLQQRLVTGLRVGPPGQLLGRQRAFGQVLKNQCRRAAALDQRAHHWRRRIGAIAGKTRAATHRQSLHVNPSLDGATVPEPPRDVNACAQHASRIAPGFVVASSKHLSLILGIRPG